MSAGGAKLQPIAALCAVLLLFWGIDAAASVVAQIQLNNKHGLWPSTIDSWAAWSVLLAFAAAAVGVLGLVCGIVGFRRRIGLHLGGLVVVASVACTVVALVIDNVKFQVPWFGNDQSLWLGYRDGLTWHALPAELGVQRWWFFVDDLLLPFAVVVLLVWLVVLATGAGRPTSSSGAVGPHRDRQVVTHAAPAVEQSQPDHEVSPAMQPRVVPAPPGRVAEAVPETAAEEPEAEDLPQVGTDPRPADDERVWFVTVQGSDHGPYSGNQLRSYVEEGRLHFGTITHLAGGEDRPLADVLA